MTTTLYKKIAEAEKRELGLQDRMFVDGLRYRDPAAIKEAEERRLERIIQRFQATIKRRKKR